MSSIRSDLLTRGTGLSLPGPVSERRALPAVLLRLGIFEIAFFLAYKFAMSFGESSSAPLWYPDAVLLSALMLNPPATWWMFLLAALPIRLLPIAGATAPLPFLLAMFVVDSLKALLAASLLRRGLKSFPRLESLREFGVFVLIAVILVPMLSAFAGAAVRLTAGHEYWPAWAQWFLGDALAILILTPAILSLSLLWKEPPRWPSLSRGVEGLSLAAAFFAVAWVALNSFVGVPYDFLILLYSPVPLLLWAAVRFGPLGTSASLCLIALLSVQAAAGVRGPFAGRPSEYGLLSIQLFLLVMGISALFLAVLVRERNQGAASLLRSEKRYREVVDSQTELVCRYRPDTTLTFVNEAYCRFFARTREQLIGRKFLELIPESAREAVRLRVASLLEDPRPMSLEHEVELPDGGVGWQQWTDSAVVGADGRVAEFQGIGRDITDRRHMEEARETLAHVSRLALLGEITASIAHEINQPLGAILSNAQAAERLLASNSASPDDLRDILEDIRKDDLRASEVIRNVRSLLHEQRSELRPVDLNALASGVLEMVGPDAAQRRVALRREFDPSLPTVNADAVQMQQALLNLIVNGMDAMAETDPQLRRLTVRTELDPKNAIQVTVRDSGPGLKPEVLPRLFDSFFTTKKQGMGLGLSLCRSIVEAHGGTIVAENAAGGGACFRLTLPRKPVVA